MKKEGAAFVQGSLLKDVLELNTTCLYKLDGKIICIMFTCFPACVELSAFSYLIFYVEAFFFSSSLV